MVIGDISSATQAPNNWARDGSLVASEEFPPGDIVGFVSLLRAASIPTICSHAISGDTTIDSSGGGDNVLGSEPSKQLPLDNSVRATESSPAEPGSNTSIISIPFSHGIPAIHELGSPNVCEPLELSGVISKPISVLGALDAMQTDVPVAVGGFCSSKEQEPFRVDLRSLDLACSYPGSMPIGLKTAIAADFSDASLTSIDVLASNTDIQKSNPASLMGENEVTQQLGAAIAPNATQRHVLEGTPQSLPSTQFLRVSREALSSDDVVSVQAVEIISGDKNESGKFSSFHFADKSLAGSPPVDQGGHATLEEHTNHGQRFDHVSHESREFNFAEQTAKSTTSFTQNPFIALDVEKHPVGRMAFVSAHEWQPALDAIINGVKSRIRIGEQEATLQIDAPDLGRVDIEIKLQGEQLSAQIVTESIESQFVVERHLGHLREALNESGFELVNIRVDSGGSPGQQSTDHDMRREGFAGGRSPDSRVHSQPLSDDTSKGFERRSTNGSLSMWA